MKSSALVFFAALLSYAMPVLGAIYYNCLDAYIPKTEIDERVRAKYQDLVAQGTRPDQFQAGSTFGHVSYNRESVLNRHGSMEITVKFDKSKNIISVKALYSGNNYNCQVFHWE
ncbi:putative candidate secreted effector protein [Blumeria hordei DH14]|uniref:Putative candidate secreted effector protein n=1 Tax=Blumeria graminis f. sp. hordei (strain DH14) TaxID=546991 RepID=N1JJR0_BLUG1|nr:putative candidate secreted effector protein [Blumeria hordei DH14]